MEHKNFTNYEGSLFDDGIVRQSFHGNASKWSDFDVQITDIMIFFSCKELRDLDTYLINNDKATLNGITVLKFTWWQECWQYSKMAHRKLFPKMPHCPRHIPIEISGTVNNSDDELCTRFQYMTLISKLHNFFELTKKS